MTASVASEVLLFTGVAVVLVSAAGLMLVRSSYDRLHLLGPAGLLGAPLVAAAVVLRQGYSADGIKTILVALLLMGSGPVVAHALGRSLRLNRTGSLVPLPAGGTVSGSGRAGIGMAALLAIALLLVAVAATAVVLTRRILNQALMVSLFGMSLTLLFFSLQAPDVALSEIVVGSVIVPIMILLALARVRRREPRP